MGGNKKNLLLERKHAWLLTADDEKPKVREVADDYISFLGGVKTEREFVKEAIVRLEKAGFVNAESVDRLKPGDKVYWVFRKKFLAAAVVGKNDVRYGLNVVASHVDVPHIDLKPYPLYEDTGLAYLNTHYYGGIKKFTWPAIPLAIHGVVIRKDGTSVEIVIGEDDNDPVFTITDIAIHISRKVQMEKKISEAVPGENLDVLFCSTPLEGEEKEAVKLYVMEKLYEKYGIVEADLVGAELQIVPAFKPRYVGLDKGAIGAFGHDDRVCGYASLKALLELDGIPDTTAVVMFFDKEEIGSVGNTSSSSGVVDKVILDLLYLTGKPVDARTLHITWENSSVLSADVDAAYDPLWRGAYDKPNSPFFGYGVTLTKYTGSGGKFHANEAHAEFYASLKRLFDEGSVVWQTGELGKVDEGGGGTVAGDFASRGADVVDIGPAVLSLHTPFEIVSVIDLYHTYKAFRVFWERYKGVKENV